LDIAQLLDRCRYRGQILDWDQIIGHAPAKRELAVVAEQHRRRPVAEALGLTLVKGIIIMGEPGCGKTLLARALAGSIDRPVYVIPAAEADAVLIRKVYDALRDSACVIVWDEADIILRSRLRSAESADRRTVASFCAALDGLDSGSGPITIALTAADEWQLDDSAMRSGRLTTKVMLRAPDRDERRLLWDLYTAGVPIVGTLDLERATDRSVGMNGADIQATVLTALGLSMVAGVDALDDAHLDEAILRRGHVQERHLPEPAELKVRALHEAGHAVFAALTWGPEAVATITLTPVRLSAARTQLADWLREDELPDRSRMREMAGMALAGMVAEELVRGEDHVSTGCGDDLSKATRYLAGFAGDLGGAAHLGPVALDEFEAGSNRGSEAMRSLHFEIVWRDSIRLHDEVRSALRPQIPLLLSVRDAVLAADDNTLSGEALTDLLRGPERP
jgi:ATP-dependent Zn protease